MFADDVLLFSKGDCNSVRLLMQTISTFSASTGLIVNPMKFKIFFGGRISDIKQELLDLTRFEEGRLPVRYLSIPLTCRRLTINHYLPLIDKIT